MHDSKLVKVLKTFNAGDWRSLQLWLQSPYYVKNKEGEQLLALLQLLKKSSPQFDATVLDKTGIQEQLTKKGVVTDMFSLDKLMSKLMKQIENYLLAEDHKNNQYRLAPHLRLAACWRKRNLTQLEERALQKAEKIERNTSAYERDDYWQAFMLAEERVAFYSLRAPQKMGEYLQETEICLDDWFLLAKLEQMVWQCAQKIQANFETHETLLAGEAILALVDPKRLDSYPLHRIYYYAYIFLSGYREANYSAYEQVNKQLQQNSPLLAPSKLKALQTILRIYAVGKYNRGYEIYLGIAYDLYRNHLENGYLYFNQKIHSQTLLNLVTLGLRHQQNEWVAQLITTHDSRILDQDNMAQVIRFCWALYAFYEQDWEKAASCLDDTYKNIYFRLAARRLEIMIFYHQDSPLFHARLEAFKIYIFRQREKQIPTKQWDLNNNFIDLLKQLIHPSTMGHDKRISMLAQKLKDTERIAERNWLGQLLQSF